MVLNIEVSDAVYIYFKGDDMKNFIKLIINGFANSKDLDVKSLSYHAKMNMPYRLELHCQYKGVTAIKSEDLLNKSATVTLSNNKYKRHFNGTVILCEQRNSSGAAKKLSISDVHLYIMPTFAVSSEMRNSRVFPSGTLIDYITEVTADYGIKLEKPASGVFIEREFCIQYDETDYDFINRLVESEGLFYYFKQSANDNVLKLGSTISDYMSDAVIQLGKGDSKIDYSSISMSNSLLSKNLTINDYDYNVPGKPLKSTLNSASKNIFDQGKVDNYLHHFPVRSFKDYNSMKIESGESFSKSRLETAQANNEIIKLDIRNAWWDFDLCSLFNVDGDEKKYVIIEHKLHVSIDSGRDAIVHSSIEGIDSQVIYHPLVKTPVPCIPNQTAVVVGTDETGNISCNTKDEAEKNILARVKFHWDIDSKHTPTSTECSCWMRVIQPWAGNNRGFIFVPRVGDEVTVMFEGGHPDMPMIIGGAYNGNNKLPYSLKDNTNVSGIVSRTVPDDSRSSAILMKDDKSSIELNLLTAGNQVNVVLKDSLRQVNENVTEHIKKDVNFTVDGSRKEKIGKSLVIEAGESICFKVGGNFVEINKDKVIVVGKKVFGNSGDSAPAGEPTELPEQKPIV